MDIEPPAVAGVVFSRAPGRALPVAIRAEGSTIHDAAGRAYLDAAGGAVVVNVGHGRREIGDAVGEQLRRIAYAHPTAFTSEPLEAYAHDLGPLLPLDGPAAIYPVSGGSEALETALKLARAYHVARGEAERWTVIARWGSYHGNTLGALDHAKSSSPVAACGSLESDCPSALPPPDAVPVASARMSPTAAAVFALQKAPISFSRRVGPPAEFGLRSWAMGAPASAPVHCTLTL